MCWGGHWHIYYAAWSRNKGSLETSKGWPMWWFQKSPRPKYIPVFFMVCGSMLVLRKQLADWLKFTPVTVAAMECSDFKQKFIMRNFKSNGALVLFGLVPAWVPYVSHCMLNHDLGVVQGAGHFMWVWISHEVVMRQCNALWWVTVISYELSQEQATSSTMEHVTHVTMFSTMAKRYDLTNWQVTSCFCYLAIWIFGFSLFCDSGLTCLPSHFPTELNIWWSTWRMPIFRSTAWYTAPIAALTSKSLKISLCGGLPVLHTQFLGHR